MASIPAPLPGGNGLYEVRFYGRGGQGSVIASTLLAEAAFLEGRDVQAFPFFGVERRGAPVMAHTRVGADHIRLTCSVAHPDAIVVMDPTLVYGNRNLLASLKEGGTVLINSAHSPKELGLSLNGKVASFDAVSLAVKYGLGSKANPIVNTVILGAFARLTGLVKLESLEEAIKQKVPVKVEKNVEAAREAYNTMRME
jgi:2-oxoacid:acceptor oxidoreductase gamma subunit (pyruvate/2-ketoisovalerate family)